MEVRTQNYIAVGSMLIAFIGLGFSWFTRNQDKTTEFMEKEELYRAKTVQDIQSIKELHKKELELHKNVFSEYRLNKQKELFDLKQDLTLAQQQLQNVKRQYEYLNSQFKLSDDALKHDILRYVKNNYEQKR
jgi:hypothetical protein